MYVRTSVSNAVASPARARSISAPSRSAAAIRAADGDGSAGTLALTESVTLGRVRDSAQRGPASGIPDLSSAPPSAFHLLRTLLELLLRRVLGALPLVLLELRRAIALLRSEHRHHLLARLGERRRERVDQRHLRRAEGDELFALLRAEVVDAAGRTPGRLQ